MLCLMKINLSRNATFLFSICGYYSLYDFTMCNNFKKVDIYIAYSYNLPILRNIKLVYAYNKTNENLEECCCCDY